VPESSRSIPVDLSENAIARSDVSLPSGRAEVYAGGEGAPLLLLHGGWDDATQWSSVWDALARRHRVIAPQLPGLGELGYDALARVADYAGWLMEVLDALDVEAATFVGSSFGATVAWSAAGRFPTRCAGLVLVNGVPMPGTPPWLLRLVRTRLGMALARRHFDRSGAPLAAKLPGSVLRTVPGAGHFPQLEQPIRFVEELERWCQQPASG
jgi:pimeloyl-ACP methyl ester carboxylesterase